jgi:tetratricopeptide (TPR) repeat protein
VAFTKKQLAGEHYLRGVKYFTDEELDKAIKEWETTLTLDPNHPKAKKDIENARALLQKLKEIK